MGHDRCSAGWVASSRMSGVITMSHNDPHHVGGDPSRIRPSAPAYLAATRHNDTFCLHLIVDVSRRVLLYITPRRRSESLLDGTFQHIISASGRSALNESRSYSCQQPDRVYDSLTDDLYIIHAQHEQLARMNYIIRLHYHPKRAAP